MVGRDVPDLSRKGGTTTRVVSELATPESVPMPPLPVILFRQSHPLRRGGCGAGCRHALAGRCADRAAL